MTRSRPVDAPIPELEPGLAVLRQSAARSGGVQTLAVDALWSPTGRTDGAPAPAAAGGEAPGGERPPTDATADRPGASADGDPASGPGDFAPSAGDPAFWIDARNAASTYALYELAPDRRALDRLRIARAFTAYQHHTLVRRVARRATPAAPLLVAPRVASLYRDDDVPDWERESLFRSALTALAELADALSVPVLASVTGDDRLAELAIERADAEIECRRTDEGYYYSVGDFETTAYWGEGYWQTTIPYWVELFGAVDEGETRPRADAERAAEPTSAPQRPLAANWG